MNYTMPDDYQSFQCLAKNCPSTCCAGWRITVDKETLGKYGSRKDGLGNRLVNSVDWETGTLRQYHGRCVLLNEEQLCDVQLEAGASWMCRACRQYPRHVERYQNERELSLSASCPAVARSLLQKQEKTTFLHAAVPGEEKEDGFDQRLYQALKQGRELLISLAQNREERLELRMVRVLALLHDLQNWIDRNRLEQVEELFSWYAQRGTEAALLYKMQRFAQGVDSRRHYREAVWLPDETELLQVQWRMLDYLREFGVLDSEWMDSLLIWRTCLYGQGEKAYQERKREFLKLASFWETEYEQIFVYFLFTWFCGAVYDGAALEKGKMAIVGVLILRELAFAQWLRQGKALSREDRAGLLWRFTRELEHSDINLNAMEQAMAGWKEAGLGCLTALLLREGGEE